MAEAWDIVGAVAAAGGTFAAAIAIWQSSRSSRAQALRDDANLVRQELKLYRASVERLVPSLCDGTVLLPLAETVGGRLLDHFAVTTKADLARAMEAVPGRISLLVRWVAEDKGAEALRRERILLQTTASSLGARLPIFAAITQLITRIADDGLSALFFNNFFQDDIRPMLLQPIKETASAAEVEGEFCSSLASNGAGYFAGRFLNALRHIQTFVEDLVEYHGGLKDEELLALVARVKTVGEAATFTEGMRAYLNRMLPPGQPATAAVQHLFAQVDSIEASLSKEAAIQFVRGHVGGGMEDGPITT
jgi:hypothetical protein